MLERLGLLKTSLIDYPGEIAAVVFTAGCNLACPFCHNPELVAGDPPGDFLPLADVRRFLARRSATLGGVCITGGEPLLHREIPQLVRYIHALGLRVKLDTNGMLPERIAAARADYVALDLKVAPARYDRLGASGASPERLHRAIEAVRSCAPAYEFRTTVVPGLVGDDDIRQIVNLLRPGERYTLAAFRPGTTLHPSFADRPAPDPAVLTDYVRIARERGIDARVRGGT